MVFKDNIKKFWMAFFGTTFVLLSYPFLLIVALFYQIYIVIFKRKHKNIANEIAVITGAARGLGKEVAIQLAKRKCHVAIVDIDLEEANKTAIFIQQTYKIKAKAYKVDVTKLDQIIELNEMVTKDLGATTILVNNAGLMLLSNFLRPDVREMTRMIDVNITSHILINHVFLPKMKELKRGHIVAIASIGSYLPIIYNSVYNCTKFGIRGLMRTLRLELKCDNFKDIHTTTVFPYFLGSNLEVIEFAKGCKCENIYPFIPTKEAAERIVRGILLNQDEVNIPGFIIFIWRLLDTLPVAIVDWMVIQPIKMYINDVKKYLSERDV